MKQVWNAAFAAALLSSPLLLAPVPALAREGSAAEREAAASAVFDRVAQDNARLRVFIQAMPKGADLHNHLSGSIYSEDFLSWSAENGHCINAEALAIVLPPCAPGTEAAGLSSRDRLLYNRMVDALSTRGWLRGVGRNEVSGHTQFFSSFERFGVSAAAARSKVLATHLRQAARDNLVYLEPMNDPPLLFRAVLAGPTGPLEDAGFAAELATVKAELPALLLAASAEIDAQEAEARAELGCGTAAAEPGCNILVRYNGQVLREFSPRQVFRHIALCLAMVEHDPRYVGVNIVMPEDGPISVGDYDLHMRMFRFLRENLTDQPLSLHAGEFALGLAPPMVMDDHIAKAISIAGARRIGHGTAIAYETGAAETLARMAAEGIAVEINLSSNDTILGVIGTEHPINLYRAAGVPIVLSTDDMGVLRIDMSNEYRRAASEHRLNYRDLKQVSRASLEYSFLPGASLWANRKLGTAVPPCAADAARDNGTTGEACDVLLAASEKARAQWRLERAFRSFETEVAQWNF